MRDFFRNLSIRNKLIVMIGGTVSLLTAGVLALVWVQSLTQARAIVQEQLDSSRDQFDSAQQGRYKAKAFQTVSDAMRPDVLGPLEHRDREAACAEVARLMELPENHALGYMALRLPDGSPLALDVRGHAPCEPNTMAWRLPDVHEAAPGVPEITSWTSPEKKVYRVFAAAASSHSAAIGTFSLGAEENDQVATLIQQRANADSQSDQDDKSTPHTRIDVVLWQEQEATPPRILGVSDPHLRDALTSALATAPNLRRPFSFHVGPSEYEVEEVVVPDLTGIAIHNPARLRSALVSSVTDRMKPFRALELRLATLAVTALLLGVCMGFIFSRPISAPLMDLAAAAREIKEGKFEAVEQIRSRHSEQGTDEIGTLSRAFVDMAGGLKQRYAMSKYMSRSAYQMIEQHEAGPAAERKWLALVFSDVRGFTAFSDDRDPALVIQRLNDVLGLEADVVRRYGGDVDKFVGDAMFAWFSGQDRCTRSVAAAAEIIAALQERFGGKQGTQIGFGIHVGEVVVGSLGSQDRRDYTAIGRSVNLAARLCSAAEPGQILVSQAVATELEGAVTLNPLPDIAAKGFPEPVRVFEVSLEAVPAPGGNGSTHAPALKK
jgi:class 3 adenylate cyclase